MPWLVKISPHRTTHPLTSPAWSWIHLLSFTLSPMACEDLHASHTHSFPSLAWSWIYVLSIYLLYPSIHSLWWFPRIMHPLIFIARLILNSLTMNLLTIHFLWRYTRIANPFVSIAQCSNYCFLFSLVLNSFPVTKLRIMSRLPGSGSLILPFCYFE